MQTFEITDGAITTSRSYEPAAHTSDPYTGIIAIEAALATVVDPSGWLCDGLETALIVVGEGGATYFSQPELVGYQVFVIGRHENSARSI